MITNTWSRWNRPPSEPTDWPAWLELPDWALTAIGPTTMPTAKATATATTQDGSRTSRAAQDHDHTRRVTAVPPHRRGPAAAGTHRPTGAVTRQSARLEWARSSGQR